MAGRSLVAVLLVGCAVENGLYGKRGSDVFQQVPNDDVDVLFVVDDSRSMHDEQVALADGFDAFLAELAGSETDYHIGVVSTSGGPGSGGLVGDPPVLTRDDDTGPLFRRRVLLGTEGSDHEEGLTTAIDALEGTPGFLRTAANLVVVFVTDEDDCSDDGRLDGSPGIACYEEREQLVPVPELVARIRALKPGGEVIRFGGILGPLDGSCPEAFPSIRYARAIGQVGGAITRICDPDWTPALSSLGLVALGIRDQFELSAAADETTLLVTVDDEEVPQDPEDGWTYAWQTRLLTFHGDAVPPRDATIRVEYEVTSDPPD